VILFAFILGGFIGSAVMWAAVGRDVRDQTKRHEGDLVEILTELEKIPTLPSVCSSCGKEWRSAEMLARKAELAAVMVRTVAHLMLVHHRASRCRTSRELPDLDAAAQETLERSFNGLSNPLQRFYVDNVDELAKLHEDRPSCVGKEV